MTGSTDAVHLKGDRFPPQGVPEPGMACVSDSARTLAAALVRTAAFRCLRDVSFLGGIDYLSPLPGKSYSPRKASCSRHEHSLGVGRLFSLYAGISGTSEYLTKLGLAAALLHDIGHCIGKIVAPPAVMMMREECCRHRIVSLLNMDP